MESSYPLFITLEGGEGCGKSSMIERLTKELESRGFSVIKTREPGGSTLGEQIRTWLLHHKNDVKVGDYAELLLFLAARAQHVEEVIEPALKEGKVVLCDRFNDSTISYQGVARGLGIDKVTDLCALTCNGVTPSMTLFFDVDPVVGLERTRQTSKSSALQGEVDRIESEELIFHERVREGMHILAKKDPKRIKTIDAAKPLEVMYQETLSLVLSYLEKQG